MPKLCKKCGVDDWGIWTSSSTAKQNYYCRNCRRTRANAYITRKKKNGGKHSNKEWTEKLSKFDQCPMCNVEWREIPKRPDKRYKYVWTKDHIIPLNLGGTDDIDNIQPLCYRCNSGKCDSL